MTRSRAKDADVGAEAAPRGGGAGAAGGASAVGGGLAGLLAGHCRRLGAEAGAVLRVGTDGRVDIAAVHPAPREGEQPPAWLHEAVASASQAAAAGGPTVKAVHEAGQLYGQPARRQLALVPFPAGRGAAGLAAFVKETDDGAALAAEAESVDLSVAAIRLYEMHLAGPTGRVEAPQLQAAMETVAAVNEHDRFMAAAMSFCNELAARWQCERVGLGFAKGRYVQLKAMSHTEKFSRQMRAAQLIEAAMEECLDQDVEVYWPAGPQAEFVNRSASELSAHGPRMTVLSLPLRRGGEVVGAATLERAAGSTFEAGETESIRLACDLCTPRLADLRQRDRWIGARAAGSLRRAAAAVISPQHTGLKIAAVLLLAAAVLLIFAKGEYRIEAPFVLEARRQQAIAAPFDGHIEEVPARIGQEVPKGFVLARLRTLPLQRQLNGVNDELFEYGKHAETARAAKKWAEVQMAMAKVRQLTEQKRLLEERIAKATIKSPIAGTVIQGDLERFVGAPVQKGQVLFEIAPLQQLRAELSVPEDQIADLLAARKLAEKDGREVAGSLATASYPAKRIDFAVEQVWPVAETEDDQTVFKVRVRLAKTHGWMRPGMKGVAHISVGRRRYAWIWSRKLVNWLRLRFWL